MSKKVAIVTDSSAYFAPGEAQELGIQIAPLTIQLGKERFLGGIDIDSDKLFRLSQQYRTPHLVSIPPSQTVFEQLYTEIHQQTDQILSIHASSWLSQTVQQARLGAEMLLGRCSIEVVDSMTTSVGLGILAKAAAKAAKDGADMYDIVRLTRGMIPHIYLVFYVKTMDYLKRAGHIGKAQAILGSMFNIKPILFMEDGNIIPLEKVRTIDRANEKLFEFVTEFDNLEQTAIIQRKSAPISDALALHNRLKQNYPDLDFPIVQYGPDLATHIGPDALGVIVYEGITY